MWEEEIVNKINELILELTQNQGGSTDTHKIAIHGLCQTRNLLIKGMSYDYYMKNGDLKPLEKIHY